MTWIPLPPDTIATDFKPISSSASPSDDGGLLDGFERDARVRIEIEDQPVGGVEPVDCRAPDVKLDRAHLHGGNKALGVIDIEVVGRVAVGLLDRHLVDFVWKTIAGVFLVEALMIRPLRAAQDRGRVIGSEGQHSSGDDAVVAGKIDLGDIRLGKEQAIGMGDADAEHIAVCIGSPWVTTLLACGRLGGVLWPFRLHGFGWRLLSSSRVSRRMPPCPRAGPRRPRGGYDRHR